MMKKKVTILIIVCFIVNLCYNLVFDFRIIKLRNSGGKKHKGGNIYYFPTIPWSIINPFKEKEILNSIRDLRGGKNVVISSIKKVGNQDHVLVYLEGSEITIVYVFQHNQIVGSY